MFLAALGELGLVLPDLDESNWIVIREHMTRIANGTVEPAAGVREMLREVDWELLGGSVGQFLGEPYEVQQMIGLYYGIDDLLDRPHEVSLDGVYGEAAIPLVEGYMRAEAVEWLDRNGR